MTFTPFDFSSIRDLYRDNATTPETIMQTVFDRIDEDNRNGLWISLRERSEVMAMAKDLEGKDRSMLPLFGLPFSVKDNIDVAGLPTTAACPAFNYTPTESATTVARLEAAGAICIGKTNLDQFATGLNGSRSPYGPCGSAFDADMLSGGSSSGSAVSVALHQVSFSIGTDTGGSGRIPAGLNNVVGLKPTLGTLSTKGLVPCCPSLDCPSVFALNVEDAVEVANIAYKADLDDPSLRDDVTAATFEIGSIGQGFKVFAPPPDQREFFGNAPGRELYDAALEKLTTLGAVIEPIDFQPIVEASRMLFDGPWVAERYAAIGSFVDSHQDEVLETTYGIVENGKKWTGVQTFEAIHRLAKVKAHVRSHLQSGGFLAVPTVATLYSIEEMINDPVDLNDHHGYYAYFANMLDLCAFSVPTGFYPTGMPFGITLLAPAFEDPAIAKLAKMVTDSLDAPLGRSRK